MTPTCGQSHWFSSHENPPGTTCRAFLFVQRWVEEVQYVFNSKGRMPLNILLDMDGVLADFNAGAIEATGIPITTDQITTWDWFEPYMTADEFYKCINSRMYFWDDLPVYPWAHELLEVCRSFGSVYFASSPGMGDEAATGKLNWLRRHGFLQYRDMNYMLGHDKWLMANPGNVLIDDSVEQVSKFHGAGGQTILFPQPWNWHVEPGPQDKVRSVWMLLEIKKEVLRD